MGKKGKKLKIFSALEVANLCGVVNQTAINWIKNGYLKAFTTPGGQYRVYAENLIEFIENRGMNLPEELIPYKTGKSGHLRILVIDSDAAFGSLLKEKASLEKKEFEIYISEENFSTGYFIGKISPDVIIIKRTNQKITPEKLKIFLENEKASIPVVISLANADSDQDNRGFCDTILNYPVDFTILFDYMEKTTGKKQIASK
jgi:excisionase family DNA binding protein